LALCLCPQPGSTQSVGPGPDNTTSVCTPTGWVQDFNITPNGDGTETFTADVSLVCVDGETKIECEYCFSFNLLVNLGGNVWQVIQPPYPVSTGLTLQCAAGTTQTPTNTTPVLNPGLYEMNFYLYPCPCNTELVPPLGHAQIEFQVEA